MRAGERFLTEAGARGLGVVGHIGISGETFYRSNEVYAGSQCDRVRQIRLSQEENAFFGRTCPRGSDGS